MLPEKPLAWGRTRSCIRDLAEYGWARKAEIGAERVFDFSIGNPSIPAPEGVNRAIAELIAEYDSITLHGYTTAAGLLSLRERIAADYLTRFSAVVDPERIYVTCGAAAALSISLHALLLPGDEVITFTPFFAEYRVFVEGAGGTLVAVPSRADDLQIDGAALERALTERTKAVIVNSPNNPSGVVLSKESIQTLAEALRRHKAKTGHTVYLISDEPYRELVYDGVEVPCLLNAYDDTLICYSFSKALSIPGERLGYIVVSSMADGDDVYYGIMGAGRSLGYVNPPSLFQRVVERCIGQTADIEQYRQNRDLLCAGLREIGYDFVEPQ
ncbi:MAG: pyridoxal phosphate-dependent aminotransferase, partial [Oscillospiraceae bacterium]|nr:pyridoxal phosphate-dependent aminotransferase [Oscillospiraceae bacterium]